MATLTVQAASPTGLDVTLAAADAGGDDFANTGNEYVHVDNASGGSITVTFTGSEACNQGFTHDAQVSVPAGESRVAGPFKQSRFGSSVSIGYSSATSVTVGVVKV